MSDQQKEHCCKQVHFISPVSLASARQCRLSDGLHAELSNIAHTQTDLYPRPPTHTHTHHGPKPCAPGPGPTHTHTDDGAESPGEPTPRENAQGAGFRGIPYAPGGGGTPDP